jgi:hypothetical protein
MTKAQIWNIVSATGYLLAAVGLAVLSSYGLELPTQGPQVWVFAAVALFWFYGLPKLLWRTNACPSCRRPMPVELRPGRAPKTEASE